MLTRAISDALRDHRANPVNVCGVLMSRRDAITLARIETLATVNPSAVASCAGEAVCVAASPAVFPISFHEAPDARV